MLHNHSNRFFRLFLTISIAYIHIVGAWQEWKYHNFATDDWRDIHGYANGPSGRQGHSMVVWNETKIILFGGRDNDIHRPHVPTTYELIEDEEDGILKFETYEDKPLLEHYDAESAECHPLKTCVNLENASSGNEEACSYSWHHILNDDEDTSEFSSSRSGYADTSQGNRLEEICGFTTSGLYYNDVWVYDLDCQRFADLPCENDGWRVLHPGERYGGCRDYDETEGSGEGKVSGNKARKCNTPSERWGHNAAMVDSSTMVVYGGYSQECEDYCDDVWAFDFNTLQWEKWTIADNEEDNIDSVDHHFEEKNPGRRWKASMISTYPQSANKDNPGANSDPMLILFGGHRLWHGFAMDNSEENLWNNVDKYPRGGYLNDLWTLEHKLVESPLNESGKTYEWKWSKRKPLESCVLRPGIGWEDRNRVKCNVFWPRERSGHAVAYDAQRHRMWIHGGYSTHFPYPSSTGPGSGDGVKGRRAKGFTPFASSQTYFLDDMWFYDIDTGYWKEIRASELLLWSTSAYKSEPIYYC